MRLSIRLGCWTKVAEYWLRRVDQDATLDDMRVQVENGAAVIYAVCDGQVVGAAVLRIDITASGRGQGVIVAAAACLHGVDIMPSLLPSIEAFFVGVESIRIHTCRAGMVRKMINCGYKPVEFVLIKKVQNNG